MTRGGQVTKLKLLKANHESQRYTLEDKLIKFFPQAIKREREMIADLEKDIAHLDFHTPMDKEHFSMTVLGTAFTEKKEAGQALIDKKMEQLGTHNQRAYLRKMAVDGYVVRVDMTE